MDASAQWDVAELRRDEFNRLDAQGVAYLDYTGSALYGSSQLRAHLDRLAMDVFGNPHADSAASRASTATIEQARDRVLEFFDVDATSHTVCFTANTTAAIGLVASSYAFTTSTRLVLSADNHNSVNGIREYAARAGSPIRYLPLGSQLRLIEPVPRLRDAAGSGGLFAFPAQSNFSGVRHPLMLVEFARSLGFDVLLDAAAFVPTSRLSLKQCSADFTVLSFYKMFGYPTGVGALIARHESLARLRRPWFSGGTVTFASVAVPRHELRPLHAGFEDGTPNFLAIQALEPGFDLLQRVGMKRIGEHVRSLTGLLLEGLQSQRHSNGCAMVQLYGPSDLEDRGGTVALNVLDPAGRPFPFDLVEAHASSAGVAIRGGCFCNPGASEAAFGYSSATLERCLAAGFTVERFTHCVGDEYAVGAIRVSPGLATNTADIQRFLGVIDQFRDLAAEPSIRRDLAIPH